MMEDTPYDTGLFPTEYRNHKLPRETIHGITLPLDDHLFVPRQKCQQPIISKWARPHGKQNYVDKLLL